MIRLLGNPLPPPVRKFEWRHTERLRKRGNLLAGERRAGGSQTSENGEIAWSSVNHSIISGLRYMFVINIVYTILVR
jgi:hypothetical protein